jgi:hypothetical protein
LIIFCEEVIANGISKTHAAKPIKNIFFFKNIIKDRLPVKSIINTYISEVNEEMHKKNK